MSFFLNETFEGVTVRISGTPEAPLFCAADVCAVLSLSNPTVALAALDEDERAKVSLGHRGEANYVTESGLYHLAFKSRKAAAKRFRRWVTQEVLPEIRKTGAFHAGEPTAGRDCKRLPLTQWVASLGLDLREESNTVTGLLSFVPRAASMLRWYASAAKGQNPDSLFQEIPVPVLELAEGMWMAATRSYRMAQLPATATDAAAAQKAVVTKTGGTIMEIIERKKAAQQARREYEYGEALMKGVRP